MTARGAGGVEGRLLLLCRTLAHGEVQMEGSSRAGSEERGEGDSKRAELSTEPEQPWPPFLQRAESDGDADGR